jgi:hypothetical protein
MSLHPLADMSGPEDEEPAGVKTEGNESDNGE